MSSMRNAVSRRPHKERSQTQTRQKWGILEKHKDYSLRAQDYNQKKRKLAILSQKSRERHPDEFAFGMLSAGSAAQGKHTGKKENENRLSHDAVKLLKTQDAGYLRTVAAQTRKSLDRVDQEISIDAMSKNPELQTRRSNGRKVIFDEIGEPPSKKRKRSSQDMLDGVEVNVLGNTAIPVTDRNLSLDANEEQVVLKPKSKKVQEREKDALLRLKAERKRRKRLQEVRAAKLEMLRKRQRDIQAAADELELQRAKMAKVIGGVNKNGVKFKIRERKR